MYQSKGETNADHAKTAIGILIMQDIFAVVFLTASKGQVPSILAIPVVLGLIYLRKPLGALLARSGHGELLVLSGLLLPLAGYHIFEMVQLKGDLGALFLGVLLAGSSKSDELSKLLFGFKELLLVTFFLSIGLRGDPTVDILIVTGILIVVLPDQNRTVLRPAHPPWYGSPTGDVHHVRSLQLLRVWINRWRVSSVKGLDRSRLAAGLRARAERYVYLGSASTVKSESIFERFCDLLHRFERPSARAKPLHIGEQCILIVGMGRMGRLTYRRIREDGVNVIGLDFDADRIADLKAEDIHCAAADGTDHEFWRSLPMEEIRGVLITARTNR